ncbi:hypothetical protein GCM10017772_38590 [Promicromonospora soli]|uniref:Uncharacterized protein n=1 Tax=Promicromonospora soli TaxID=2035533 RepID=A0A919G3J7_9MICO|nr:hypothetical protein GCM10017772_38590 [Promicromonospora soli]
MVRSAAPSHQYQVQCGRLFRAASRTATPPSTDRPTDTPAAAASIRTVTPICSVLPPPVI